MSNKTRGILLTAVVLALLLLALVGAVFFRKIGSTGTIATVGCQVFWDSALTQNVTSIDWGTVRPGSETNKTVYIQNTSNVPANLTLGTENWNPNATSTYIALYWNYNNQTLAVNQAIPVIFMLDVFSNVTGITTFSFTIDIIANG